jgi:hypothetical protein
MGGLKLPVGPVEILGDRISRISISAPPDKRLEAIGLAVMEYAKEKADAAYLRGLHVAADIAATLAERPFDNEPEFSTVLAVEVEIRREIAREKHERSTNPGSIQV